MNAEEREEWHRDQESLAREAAEGQESAPGATQTGAEAEKVLPDPARVARYAEAINRTAVADSSELMRDLLDAVKAVADSEQSALVAERDGLRAEVKRGRGSRDALYAELRLAQARAEAAEAKLAQVEALHVKAEGGDFCAEDGFTWPCVTVRALADDAPAEQRAVSCAACGNPDVGDGPTGSDGKPWCGDCYAEAQGWIEGDGRG
ncbi:MAG: hypothetical protein ACXVXO_01015 [Mycobacteriaceae bacterium]